MRFIESDENLSMRGEPLKLAIEKDLEVGLIPFWVGIMADVLSVIKKGLSTTE